MVPPIVYLNLDLLLIGVRFEILSAYVHMLLTALVMLLLLTHSVC